MIFAIEPEPDRVPSVNTCHTSQSEVLFCSFVHGLNHSHLVPVGVRSPMGS
jgi:hypothetical protein